MLLHHLIRLCLLLLGPLRDAIVVVQTSVRVFVLFPFLNKIKQYRTNATSADTEQDNYLLQISSCDNDMMYIYSVWLDVIF